MPVNPAIKPESLNNPTQRANSLNDPQFSEQQGYFPYDLTHGEYISARFGEASPTMHLDTVPADRFAVHDNTKLVLNQISGNLLNTVNQYVDSFYIPLRSCFPNNYEKLIPNPTKGSDLPNSALPQIPFFYWLNYLLSSTVDVELYYEGNESLVQHNTALQNFTAAFSTSQGVGSTRSYEASYALGYMIYISTILSRGQLLDNLGVQLDLPGSVYNPDISSYFQGYIDEFYNQLWLAVENAIDEGADLKTRGVPMSLTFDTVAYVPGVITDVTIYDTKVETVSQFRSFLSDVLERGLLPDIRIDIQATGDYDYTAFYNAYNALRSALYSILNRYGTFDIDAVDTEPTPFENGGYINIVKPLAYQQVIAHYYSNDSVDNIFTSDLFMQNLRAVMYPTTSRFTSEPIFEYNGVQTEYDYISTAGWYYSTMYSQSQGSLGRSLVVGTMLFLMRRTLRYGDYFSTARPRMLAVGQLNVAIGYDEDGNATGVSPIDITKNLLMQRYLNAANYVGSRFLNYYASMYGVTPSDTGTFPRFLAHRKIELQNQITNNTAGDQGAQTTNLVGYSDNNAFDVFIDDFGVLLNITSFDVLPVYTSGIDSTYHFSDRFDYFNPMLQNVGDQPIRFSELIGHPAFIDRVFGWTMRNAELKFKITRAHGALVNGAQLNTMLIRYPFGVFGRYGQENFTISPEYIRDKPSYLDRFVPASTGVSPADYFHFIVACVNQVHCARKVQAQPPVLF